MKLFSTTLDVNDLTEIGDSLGIDLHEVTDEGVRQRGKNKGHRCIRFTLRPQKNAEGEKRRLVRLSYEGKTRRVWAVSWQGHYDFMERLFTNDPMARLETSIATYDGMVGFKLEAPLTTDKNIGSIMQPLYYGDADHAGLS